MLATTLDRLACIMILTSGLSRPSNSSQYVWLCVCVCVLSGLLLECVVVFALCGQE